MSDDVDIRVRLLEAAKAARDAKMVSSSVRGMGLAATEAGMSAGKMGDMYAAGVERAGRGLRNLAGNLKYAALGTAALGVAGVKWGLQYDAQVETARMRFKLFTNDVNGLTKSLQHIDFHSQFNFADLADTAAQLGNFGVKAEKIPRVVQGIANAAAASGKGTAGLQNISLAISQIASKGRLMGQEMLQLQDAPGSRQALMKAFHLTAGELGQISSQGINGAKAIDALTKAWTSGRLATAANAYTKTLAGQWSLLTTQLQKDIGIFEGPLAMALEHTVLPAANKAAASIQSIFSDKNLSNEQKLRRARQVIGRDLGPIADDLKHKIEQANIPAKLGQVVGAGIPYMARAAAQAGPAAAKAFVGAWLHSGPWGMLLTTLYGGAKLHQLTRGLGGAGGVAGGLLGAARSMKPIPVYVVNGPGGVPGLPSGAKTAEKGAVENGFRKAIRLGRDLGPAGIAAGVVTYGLINSKPIPHGIPGWAHGFGSGNPNTLSGMETNPFRQNFIGGLPIQNTVVLKVGNTTLARQTALGRAQLKARRAGG